MQRHKLDYEAVAGQKHQLLKPVLVKVQESLISTLVRLSAACQYCLLQVNFTRRHKFDYEAVGEEEDQLLQPDLVDVRESHPQDV